VVPEILEDELHLRTAATPFCLNPKQSAPSGSSAPDWARFDAYSVFLTQKDKVFRIYLSSNVGERDIQSGAALKGGEITRTQ